MRRSLEETLSDVGRPRPLPVAFRSRLEEALTTGDVIDSAGVDDARWTFDRPREMPDPVRRRVEAALVTRRSRRPQLFTATIAAAVFLLDQLMSEHGIAAPARLLTDATTGAGAWILVLLCMPGAFIAPSLRVFLSRLERHFPTRLRPFLQQITASA